MWLPVRRPNDPAGARGFLATGVGPVGQGNGNVGAQEGATHECHTSTVGAAFVPPLRGLGTVVRRVPRAYARGYVPSLRRGYRVPLPPTFRNPCP